MKKLNSSQLIAGHPLIDMLVITAIKTAQRSPAQVASGFTLLEIMIALLIIGITSAIAAPSWMNFVNKQKSDNVNEAVFSALQKAQQEARNNKLSYSISFKTQDTPQGKVPVFAIYPANTTPTTWERLGKDLGLKPGQILLGTNFNVNENTADSAITYASNVAQTISFTYTGNLPSNDPELANTSPRKAALGSKGLIVTVALPQSNNYAQPDQGTRRCVKVKTLLGAMQIGQKDECNAS